MLAESELAEDSPTAVDCSGVPVVLIRHEGRISALGGQCPHLGAPMAEGWLYRDQFVCPWHGSRFDSLLPWQRMEGVTVRESLAAMSIDDFADLLRHRAGARPRFAQRLPAKDGFRNLDRGLIGR